MREDRFKVSKWKKNNKQRRPRKTVKKNRPIKIEIRPYLACAPPLYPRCGIERTSSWRSYHPPPHCQEVLPRMTPSSSREELGFGLLSPSPERRSEEEVLRKALWGQQRRPRQPILPQMTIIPPNLDPTPSLHAIRLGVSKAFINVILETSTGCPSPVCETGKAPERKNQAFNRWATPLGSDPKSPSYDAESPPII